MGRVFPAGAMADSEPSTPSSSVVYAKKPVSETLLNDKVRKQLGCHPQSW